MAAYYVHVLPFSMMSEKLEIGFFHGQNTRILLYSVRMYVGGNLPREKTAVFPVL
jgi:hypothetical protein